MGEIRGIPLIDQGRIGHCPNKPGGRGLPVATETESIGGLAGASGHEQRSLWPFYLLFFLSGFPALLYQIVWQRALFTIYGVNIESITIIVTVFMLGLGLGSLAGGSLSKRANIPLLAVFAAIELGIAV